MDRNLAAFKVECDKYAPGISLIECNNKANASKAEGANLVEAATKQLAELRKFVQEKDIVTVPGTEECKVAQAPLYKAWNFAYINIPGPYEKGLPSVYYVSPPDPSWPKEKQDAYVPRVGSVSLYPRFERSILARYVDVRIQSVRIKIRICVRLVDCLSPE